VAWVPSGRPPKGAYMPTTTVSAYAPPVLLRIAVIEVGKGVGTPAVRHGLRMVLTKRLIKTAPTCFEISRAPSSNDRRHR